MNSLSKTRLSIVLLIFILSYLVVIIKLFYWQVTKSGELKDLGINQSSESLLIPAIRGDILTSDNYPLATTNQSYLLYSNPIVFNKDSKSTSENIQKIAEVIGKEKEWVKDMLSKNLFWVKLADRLDESQKTKIENMDMPGFGFENNNIRFYPEASMAAQLIGFVGKDENGQNRGYFGIEGYYNDQLQGRSGRMYMIHDALGNPILNDIREEKAINGRNLVLNIDRTVQYIVENKLKEGLAKYRAEGGNVVVMEPNTGKIFAMASLPQYDPKNYFDYDYELHRNPIISNLYEPGSTFKVLVMSSAIDMGLVTPSTECSICSGLYSIGEYQIKTWNEKYYPESTMTEVIQHSDNVGMVYVGKKLGVGNLVKYLKLFGFGENTGIDLQGEISSDIRNEDNWYPIDLATASFGQGISLTPMQLLIGVSAIANGGNIIKPYVVSQIITEDGRKISIAPQIKRKVIGQATATAMKDMMVNAVENGEAKWTKIPNYKVAGKTGTAQIPIKGRYDLNETIASFVGFFPDKNPRISMLVMLNKPKTSIYGSETAAPIFFSIAKELIAYYNIQPSY